MIYYRGPEGGPFLHDRATQRKERDRVDARVLERMECTKCPGLAVRVPVRGTLGGPAVLLHLVYHHDPKGGRGVAAFGVKIEVNQLDGHGVGDEEDVARCALAYVHEVIPVWVDEAPGCVDEPVLLLGVMEIVARGVLRIDVEEVHRAAWCPEVDLRVLCLEHSHGPQVGGADNEGREVGHILVDLPVGLAPGVRALDHVPVLLRAAARLAVAQVVPGPLRPPLGPDLCYKLLEAARVRTYSSTSIVLP